MHRDQKLWRRAAVYPRLRVLHALALNPGLSSGSAPFALYSSCRNTSCAEVHSISEGGWAMCTDHSQDVFPGQVSQCMQVDMTIQQ